mgnify:CR=1 FL=1
MALLRSIRVSLLVATLLGPNFSYSILASDYFNECKSTDGRYIVEDEVLYRAGDKDRSTKLTYAIVEEQVLAERRSYCIPSNPEAQGQKFENYSRNSRQTVEIDDGGRVQRATLTCELAASGLPAAYDCAREVVTFDNKLPGPLRNYRLGTPGNWSHNNSVMRLDADGARRSFYYMNPRPGLRALGVSGGTLLFEGARDGYTYRGTARYFTRTCGVQQFPVSGTVSADESRIELTGVSQRLDAACNPSGTRQERLVFERAG